MILVGIVVVLVAAGLGYRELAHPRSTTTSTPGKVVNLPETTVNLPNGHLLQVSVALQLVQGEQITAAEMVVIENDEIDTLSSFHFSELLTTTGKTAARSALVSEFNSVIDPAGPPPTTIVTRAEAGPVLAVYFTYFVMQ